MNYDESVAWLYSTQEVGIKLGLESIRDLLAALGLEAFLERPHPRRPVLFHIAGTNGKGSVCAMLDAICRAAGYRCGLFTSPHLVTYRERIRLNGVMIPEAEVARILTRIRGHVAGRSIPPTFFEITTALALAWFAQEGAEVCVLETGLGGRLDSTNAVAPDVAVLTPISFDHHQYLGNTLEKIAGEKAGIIKPRTPVVSSRQFAPAARVIAEKAHGQAAPLCWAREPVAFPVALAGSHQRYNAALAISALAAVSDRLPVRPEAIREGLQQVSWPGRFQKIAENPTVILDGAHNEAAALRLVQTWEESAFEKRPVVVFGALADKDLPVICRSFAPLGPDFILVPVRNPRSATPEALAAVFHREVPEARPTLAGSLEEALATARARALEQERPILITGSFFLIGQAMALLEGGELEPVSRQ